MAIAYIALGSNIGDREGRLRAAIQRLAQAGTVEAVSPFLDTAPVGYTDQPRFLNAAVRLRTDLPADELMQRLLAIEAGLGRERTIRWGPRTIDLDLLLYDDVVRDEPGLTLPHPRLHERRFVLEPLAAIAPDAVHPRLGTTVRELLDALTPQPPLPERGRGGVARPTPSLPSPRQARACEGEPAGPSVPQNGGTSPHGTGVRGVGHDR